MACNVTSGRVLPCKAGFGGIKAAYFFDLDALGALEYTDGVITTIAGTPTVYEYDVKNTSSLETAINSSRETGTTFYEQTLSLTLTYLDAATQEQIKLIAWGRPSVAVEDYYGNMFVCGFENGMELSGGRFKRFLNDIGRTRSRSCHIHYTCFNYRSNPRNKN